MKLISFALVFCVCIISCEKEVCQECEIIRESNKLAVVNTIKSVSGGLIYRIDEEPFLEQDREVFITCDLAEMDRVERLDNIVETKPLVSNGNIVQYHVKWYANCRLLK